MSLERRVFGCLVAASFLVGCAGGAATLPGVSGLPRRPGYKESAEVTKSRVRAGYIEATLQLADGPLGLYFPDVPVCRDLLVAGASAQYQLVGTLGRVLGPGDPCVALGTHTLVAWRARQPRVRLSHGNRQTARFERVHTDDDVLMARGRFPGAGYLGFVSDDLVAVVPSTPECRSILQRRDALMEFRATGDSVLALLEAGSRCEITGLVQPIRS